VKIIIASVGGPSTSQSLADVYLDRIAHYTQVEAKVFRSESTLLDAVERQRARTSPVLVLFDSRGKTVSSEEFSAWIGRQRDGGTQNLTFAVGPADGWSESARNRAQLLLSLGAMTLPHELARVVLAEQVYRAFTILAGHPYHGGH
jgi:23S rRNA (pseudouridine1915-N3)-methyltransferase